MIPSLSTGGTERQLTHLIKGLAPDHDILLVCTHVDGALIGDARRIGAHVVILPTRGGWDLRLRPQLRRFLRAYRPDILHSFLFGFDLFANKAARDVGTPVVISSRRELPVWMKRRHRFMQQLANRHVDCVVANSRAAGDFAVANEGLDPALLRVIHNGINARDYMRDSDIKSVRVRYKIPFHRHIIGIVANYSPVKDHFLFLDAAAELLRRRADLHFLLVGRGPMERDIKARAKRLNISECCTCVSTVGEMTDLYALMDVSVLCSKAEGFPNAVIEAMAAGKPVVAANVGGIPEIIRHGDTGILVGPRTASAYADAIEQVLQNPAMSHAMGQRASAFVEAELSVERMVDAHRRLYAELLAAKRTGR